MKTVNASEIVKKTLLEAFELNRNVGMKAAEIIRLIFVLLFFKRVSDCQTGEKVSKRITIPLGKDWNSVLIDEQEHLLIRADSNIREICVKNEMIRDLADSFGLKKYDRLISKEKQEDLFALFSSLDLSAVYVQDSDLARAIESFFDEVHYSNKDSEEFRLPSYLNRLVIKLLDPIDREYFYVPSFGYGLIFLTAMQHVIRSGYLSDSRSYSIKVGGCEENRDSWAIAVLIGLLVNISIDRLINDDYFSTNMEEILSGEYLKKDPEFGEILKKFTELLEERPDKEKKTWKDAAKTIIDQAGTETLLFFDQLVKATNMESDVLFLNPPYSRMMSRNNISSNVMLGGHAFEVPRASTELLYLLFALKQLRKEGRMAAILPLQSLAREGGARKIWQALFENDYVEAIIQLPNALSGHSMSMVLVMLSKKKAQAKKYRFAFIKFEATDDRAYNTDEEIERVYRAFKDFRSKSNNDIVVSLEDIQRNYYRVSPIYYAGGIRDEIKKLVDGKVGRKIAEVCEVIRGRTRGQTQNAVERGIPVVMTKDLSKDITHPYLDLASADMSASDVFGQRVGKRCILVSLVGKDPKPTIYEPEEGGTGILVGNNVAILFPNETIVNFEYLYYQLYTPLVRNQFELFLGGTGIPHLSLPNLKSIVVSIPPLEIQHSLTYQQKSLLLRAENRRHQETLERLKAIDKKQEAEFGIVRHLTHSIRPKLHIVRSPVLSLIDFLDKKHLLDETLSLKLDGTEEPVRDAIGQVVKTIDQISDILTNTRKLVASEISRNDFRNVDIYSVFENDILPLYSNKQFKAIITHKGGCMLRLHKESFIEAVHNLIRNAEVHAFDGKSKNPEVRFDIRGEEGEVIIDYFNNGTVFPEDMTAEQFLTFGEKSVNSPGEGLGGAWIGRFLDAHMGTFEIIRDKHPVHFRITLPRSYR